MNTWTDWQKAFECLFSLYQPTKVLEFGLGKGTSFFLKKGCDTTSIELASREEHVDWYKKFSLDTNPQWKRHLYKCEEIFEPKVKKYIEKELDKKYDLVFVDSGVRFRSDIVNLCFGKTDIIAAHDTNFGHSSYEWHKIEKPKEYIHAHYSGGQGTTFWIKDKNLGEKAEKLLREAHQ